VEDTLDHGALPVEAAGRPELEHDNSALGGAEDEVIVRIPALRDLGLELLDLTYELHVLTIIGDGVERKGGDKLRAGDPYESGAHYEDDDEQPEPFQQMVLPIFGCVVALAR